MSVTSTSTNANSTASFPHAAINALHAATLLHALTHPHPSGVRHIVVSPGSRSTPLVLAVDALAAARRIASHVVLDERSAAFMALGLARGTGAPVALVCTSGSAGAHYLPALIEASESGLPLIVITADRPRELHGCGAAQTIEQAELFGRFVRWQFSAETPAAGVAPNCLGAIAAQALDWATLGRPGPVHLNLPFREPLWDAASAEAVSAGILKALAVPHPPAIRRPHGQTYSTVDAGLIDRVTRSPRGVIAVGPLDSPPCAHIVALAKVLQWPILADGASGLRQSAARIPSLITATDALVRSPEFARISRPDFVIRLGRAVTSKNVAQWLAGVAEGHTLLLDPAGQWHDPQHVGATMLAGPLADLLTELVTALKARKPAVAPAWLAAWEQAEQFAQTIFASYLRRPPLWEGAVARIVAEALPKGASGAGLHLASSMPIRDADYFVAPTEAAATVYCNRGANGIDGTLATIAGEALAKPERPFVGVLGDLAFLHDVGSLLTLAQLRETLRLTLVVIDNGGGAIFEFLPIGQHPAAFTPYFLTPQHADLAGIATAFGLSVTRVNQLGEFHAALANLGAIGIRVVVVTIDRAANLARHREIWSAFAGSNTAWLDGFRADFESPPLARTADPRGLLT